MIQKNTKSRASKKGSILIWTVLLGTLLASAFLFFILRFGDGRALRQAAMSQTIERQYLESVMGYFKSLSVDQLNAYKTNQLDLFDGEITGRVTNEFTVIEGVLDAGETLVFPDISDEVAVFWNRCDIEENAELQLREDIVTSSPQCINGSKYNQVLVIEASQDLPLELTAPAAPLHFAVKSTTPEERLPGNRWLVELRIAAPYRHRAELIEWFIPLDG